MITARRLVRVDGKVRTDLNFPCGFQDIVTIEKTDERFRLLYDVKGRFILHRIQPEEAQYKLAKVVKVDRAKKASIGHNPFQKGHAAVIPYLVTHDGRTIRYPDPNVKVDDTVKINIEDGKITGHLKFEVGQLAIVTRGANVGRIGTVTTWDRHPGSFDIIHLKDARGAGFATRRRNVFVIGEGKKEWISLPRGKGIKYSILEERERTLTKKD
jgi:small subunit ribosomal protein S4e